MKKLFILSAFLLTNALTAVNAQRILFDKAKFHVGDDASWKEMNMDDSGWQELSLSSTWSAQGVSNPDGYAWYRIKFVLPENLKASGDMTDALSLEMGKIDDADETYLNGVLIGKTGRTPADKGGYASAWDTKRAYVAEAKRVPIYWGKENLIAVRVYNGNEPGGMFTGGVTLSVPSRLDALSITLGQDGGAKNSTCTVSMDYPYTPALKGMVEIKLMDAETGDILGSRKAQVSLKKGPGKSFTFDYDIHKQTLVSAVFTDRESGKTLTKTFSPKYILTPAAPATPRYNGPAVYGVRPGSPIIYRIPTTGERPIKFSADNLPEGVSLDTDNGILSGAIQKVGDYAMTLRATNAKGTCEAKFTIKVGDKLALTPPMGWNSWNCWGLSVSQQKVISSAQAILDKGLADYGYSYINVDDAWEAEARNADGTIAVNDKFPSMKQLGDWLHSHGLKFGIYSSPGDRTCGNYLGSIGHEQQDAESYNSWGIDYLKYDWCGYGKVFEADPDKSVAAYVRPYLLMEKYLRQQPRDIFYSLCQYGMADVWKWGHAVDANSWRTTGDITDTWESLYDIGFCRQTDLWPYAGPGHWNDPDMLIVGKVGWSATLRDTRLTPDEQYTHITLWTLLASNMLIGCDVAQIDDFTIGLLCNNEVNAVNQDPLGQQAKREVLDGNIQIWKRPLSDGSYAVGIFNLGNAPTTVDFSRYFRRLGIYRLHANRDLWRQKDISVADTRYLIPSHGVKYLKIRY